MHQAILLVDDAELNRQLVRHILADTYPVIFEASNGNECLEILEKESIDLVLLDLNMPEKSGYDVLVELKEQNRSRNPAIIVVSAESDPISISRTFQLGAADYVTTPFNRDELLARVRTHLALHNREQYLEERVTERTAELVESNRLLKDTHSQLLQAEKMASLGQLAAGVAHEINNPVGYISSNIGMLKDYCDDIMSLLELYEKAESAIGNTDLREQIEMCKSKINLDFLREDMAHLLGESTQGVKRVTRIVADLKGFSHPEQQEWQEADLQEIVDSALNIVHGELKYKARIVKEYHNPPKVECIAPQINQVLLNLLVNAGQAIEENGTITITTGIDDKHPAGERAYVSIHDTGSGMTQDIQKKIFDPFFTSKPVGQGTGLGLSVSYGIMQNHRGEIRVDSSPGEGSCFTISLPVKQQKLLAVN